MSRRIVIEEPCEHGTMERHLQGVGPETIQCPGGSRTVWEEIPEEWAERAATVLFRTEDMNAQLRGEAVDSARVALEVAVFGGSDVEG